MTIKYRLLASALVPVMAGWVVAHPAHADNRTAPLEMAQAQPLTPEDEELLKRKVQEAAPAAAGDDAQPRPPKQEKPAAEPATDAQPAPKPQREAAPAAAGDDAQPRPPKQEKPAAEPAADAQPAPKPQREAAPAAAGDDAQPRPPKREKPAAEPAADAQPAPKPQREVAPAAAGDDAQPRPPKREKPAADPATDAQPAPKPQREAAPAAAGDDAQPRPPKGEKPAVEPATDAQPAPKPQREATPSAAGDDAQPRPPKREKPAAEPATDAQPAPKPQREAAPAAAGDDAQPRPPKQEKPAAEPATDAQPAPKPQREAAPPAAGNDAQPLRPGSDSQTAPEPQRQAPPIEDRRTERERKAIAADPSKTDDTVVLPVDKGAAVLDSDKDADNRGGQSSRDERRRDRERQREKADDLPPPRNDAEAQRRAPVVRRDQIEAGTREEGRRRDQAPDFLGALLGPLVSGIVNPGDPAPRRFQDRTVYETDDGIVVRSDERRRLSRASEETYYEDLPRGRVRETIIRPDGGRLITIYNRYGDVIQRSRMTPDGREVLLVFAPEADQQKRPPVFRDPGDDLPPMRLRIPVQDYIIDTSSNPNRNYYDFLSEPPVEQVERVYTMDEVKYSARLRDKVRRIDLDTITFATGSAEVPMSQAATLRSVADAMLKVLKHDPGETFLIEGHTDAVGSDEANLVLSDRRAESVANLLTDVYGIPPENLATQGYGERYLKVRTEAAEQQNRRVTIRRVTSLVRPATAQQ